MSFLWQNSNRRPCGDAPNPNATSPVLHSFFPLTPNDMKPTSPTPDTTNPTPSFPPTFAPSQTANPRSFQLFLSPSHAVNESLLLNDPTIHSRPLYSQEARSASRPAGRPPVLRKQRITADSEITRYGLEELARQLEEVKREEAAQISHLGLQICNPQAQIAPQTPKSDPVPSIVRKAASSKATASDLFYAADALGGDTLVDLVRVAYTYYLTMDETEGPSGASMEDRSKLEKL